MRWLVPLFMLTEEQGARTVLYCATSSEVKQTGLYYEDCAVKETLPHGQDKTKMDKLVDTTAEWLGLQPIMSHL